LELSCNCSSNSCWSAGFLGERLQMLQTFVRQRTTHGCSTVLRAPLAPHPPSRPCPRVDRTTRRRTRAPARAGASFRARRGPRWGATGAPPPVPATLPRRPLPRVASPRRPPAGGSGPPAAAPSARRPRAPAPRAGQGGGRAARRA